MSDIACLCGQVNTVAGSSFSFTNLRKWVRAIITPPPILLTLDLNIKRYQIMYFLMILYHYSATVQEYTLLVKKNFNLIKSYIANSWHLWHIIFAQQSISSYGTWIICGNHEAILRVNISNSIWLFLITWLVHVYITMNSRASVIM